MDKKVDISIFKNGKPVAAIGVKFVMSNYEQNSNNYFENMLGETANLRSNGIAYFQLLILPSSLPYFSESTENNKGKKEKKIMKIEHISKHHLDKYINLSNNNPDLFMHIPNKTLLYIVDFPEFSLSDIYSKEDYINYYKNIDITVLPKSDVVYPFGEAFIYNDFEAFINNVIDCCIKKGNK